MLHPLRYPNCKGDFVYREFPEAHLLWPQTMSLWLASTLCHAIRLIAALQVLGKVTEDLIPPCTNGASDGKFLQQGACQPGQSNKVLDSSKMRPPIAPPRQPQRGGLERCVACYIALAIAPVA